MGHFASNGIMLQTPWQILGLVPFEQLLPKIDQWQRRRLQLLLLLQWYDFDPICCVSIASGDAFDFSNAGTNFELVVVVVGRPSLLLLLFWTTRMATTVVENDTMVAMLDDPSKVRILLLLLTTPEHNRFFYFK